MTTEKIARPFEANYPFEARETLRRIHTMIARAAADMIDENPQIRPTRAVRVLFDALTDRLAAEHPTTLAVYAKAMRMAAAPEMDYRRFMSFVDRDVRIRLAGDRLRLVEDRKVAGA
ncbi:hypothetical protein [Spirillospora sp. CA-294931]|uniref:hypothetical protein n=1 Tax=Spirillospora sp. CA-294931 TaxID=3240042 RepID=UPI003D907CD3